jgi:peroxiredoxin
MHGIYTSVAPARPAGSYFVLPGNRTPPCVYIAGVSKLAAHLRTYGPWLLVAALAGVWILWTTSGNVLPEGGPAPALSVPWTESGEGLDLARERGHVVVLAFWATWCPACRAEGPELSRVHRTIERNGDRVVGISIDEAPLDAIARAARNLGMTYPIAHARRDQIAAFRVDLLPTIIVVDRQGRIFRTFRGTASADDVLEAVEDAREDG